MAAAVTVGHLVTLDATRPKTTQALSVTGLVAKNRRLTLIVKKWRRRESNANGDFHNDQDAQGLENSAESESTVGPRTGVSERREVAVYAPNDSSSALDYIAAAWPRLQPHVRETIFTLIEGILRSGESTHG